MRRERNVSRDWTDKENNTLGGRKKDGTRGDKEKGLRKEGN